METKDRDGTLSFEGDDDVINNRKKKERRRRKPETGRLATFDPSLHHHPKHKQKKRRKCNAA